MSLARGSGILVEHSTPTKQIDVGQSQVNSSLRDASYRREPRANISSETMTDGGSPKYADRDYTSMQLLSSDAPASEINEAWSSAVGRATTAGKSGRVIERLMADNDKLRREVKLLSLRSEEVQRREESIKSTLDSLRATNQNLEAICDTNTAALDRRDRKIETLKVDLANEKARREKAEREQRETLDNANQAISASRRDLFHAQETSAHALSQYETLQRSLKQIENEYQERVMSLSSEAQALLRERRADWERFQTLEALCRQLRTDQDRATQAYREMLDRHETHKRTSDRVIQQFAEQAKVADEKLDQLKGELLGTLSQMRHVMGVKKHFRGELNE